MASITYSCVERDDVEASARELHVMRATCMAKLAVSLCVSEAFVLVPLQAHEQNLPSWINAAALATQPAFYILASPIFGWYMNDPVGHHSLQSGTEGNVGATRRDMFQVSLQSLLLGLMLTALGTFGPACGSASAWPVLLLARAVQGIGAAAAELAAMVLVANSFPTDRLACAEGWLEMATGLGYALGLPIAGILYSIPCGMIVAMGVGVASCLTAIYACSRMWSLAQRVECKDGSGIEISNDCDECTPSVDRQRLAAVTGLVFLFGLLMGVVYTSLVVTDVQLYGFGPAESSGLLMLIAVAYIIVSPIVGHACEGPPKVSQHFLVVGQFVGILAYSLLAVQGSVVCQGLGLLLLGMSEALVLIPAYPVLLDFAGGATGTASALLNTSYLAGESIGSLLSMYSVGRLGFSGAMAGHVLVMTMMATIACLILRPIGCIRVADSDSTSAAYHKWLS